MFFYDMLSIMTVALWIVAAAVAGGLSLQSAVYLLLCIAAVVGIGRGISPQPRQTGVLDRVVRAGLPLTGIALFIIVYASGW